MHENSNLEHMVTMSGNSRRVFLRGLATVGGVKEASSVGALEATRSIDFTPRVQPPLFFAPNALKPMISARTGNFHYNKHHKSYFTNIDKLVEDSDMAHAPIEGLSSASAGRPNSKALFNNAAQYRNHNLNWQSLSPIPTRHSPLLTAAIQRDFISQSALIEELAKTTSTQSGTGWGDGAKLKVGSTSSAGNPLTDHRDKAHVAPLFGNGLGYAKTFVSPDTVAVLAIDRQGHLWPAPAVRFRSARLVPFGARGIRAEQQIRYSDLGQQDKRLLISPRLLRLCQDLQPGPWCRAAFTSSWYHRSVRIEACGRAGC